jgi:CRISPR-associated endonuclease/helicase Cas3
VRSEIARSVNAELSPPPRLHSCVMPVIDDDGSSLETLVERFRRTATFASRHLRLDPQDQLLLACAKALVISGDLAASALYSGGVPNFTAVASSLGNRLSEVDAGGIAAESLGSRSPRQFQESVARAPHNVTIVVAGCGNGKTTAAYMWACRWSVGKKLFFTYPTTGTASAGFEEYLLPQTSLQRTLMHSRAIVDLEAMGYSPEDDRDDAVLKAESLKAWGQQVIACTADVVLGLIQNQRRSLFSFPAIACGAFIFDEIHSYDRRLFGALLRFMRTFPRAPMLLMSASIPPARLAALREACGQTV